MKMTGVPPTMSSTSTSCITSPHVTKHNKDQQSSCCSERRSCCSLKPDQYPESTTNLDSSRTMSSSRPHGRTPCCTYRHAGDDEWWTIALTICTFTIPINFFQNPEHHYTASTDTVFVPIIGKHRRPQSAGKNLTSLRILQWQSVRSPVAAQSLTSMLEDYIYHQAIDFPYISLKETTSCWLLGSADTTMDAALLQSIAEQTARKWQWTFSVQYSAQQLQLYHVFLKSISYIHHDAMCILTLKDWLFLSSCTQHHCEVKTPCKPSRGGAKIAAVHLQDEKGRHNLGFASVWQSSSNLVPC